MKPLQVCWLGRQEYVAMCGRQEELVRQRRADAIPDTLLLLEHDPVITIGRGGSAEPTSLLLPDGTEVPVVETPRGGQATYHCPGQLVGYPIFDLRQHRLDLHWHLRSLEEVLIETLAELGVSAERQAGYTGVWVGEQKIASIGVAVRGWITYHGFALNVDCDLAGFGLIDPCGLPADRMTRLADVSCRATVAEVWPLVEDSLRRVYDFGA